MKVSSVFIAALFTCSAHAYVLPKSYVCKSEPVTVKGQTITVRAIVETGFLNSFRSVKYNYQLADGTEVSGSSADKTINCHTTGSNLNIKSGKRETTDCEPAQNDKLIEFISVDSAFGLSFTAVDSPKVHFVNCEFAKTSSAPPAVLEDSSAAR